MTTTRNRPARPGFTLIEILVAMSLIILLAALALGVSQTGMFGSQKVISGGDRASGWLLIAKQRAMRDGQPRGVRFFNSTANPTAFTEAAYIEQPDAWVPNLQQEGNPSGARIVFCVDWNLGTAPAPNTANQPRCYYVTGSVVAGSWNYSATDIDEFDQRMTPATGKDSLVLPELGKSFLIAGILIPPNTDTIKISGVAVPSAAMREISIPSMSPDFFSASGTQFVSSTSRSGTLTSYKFGFQRPPQPLLGEPALQLTGGTSIDFRFGTTLALLTQPVDGQGYRTWSSPSTGAVNAGPFNPPTTVGVTSQLDAATGGQFFDILFSPSGQVLNNNAGIVCLWVRETSKVPHPRLDATPALDTVTNFDAAGAQVLIVLNTRNGLISTQPINPPPAAPSTGYDPYQFAKDGINSGL